MGKGGTMYFLFASIPFVLVVSYLESGSISTGSRERSSPGDAGNRSRNIVSSFTGTGELERKHGRESTSQAAFRDMTLIATHNVGEDIYENGNAIDFHKKKSCEAMRSNQNHSIL